MRARLRSASAASTSAIVAALARREAATRGVRLSMTVRLSGTEHASVLPSPAYLAVDDAGGIRLQVLSPFGMTVLDLAIRGDAYTLNLPMRNHTATGTIDPRALADPAVPVSDRMIVALALMFRPKARADACAGVAPATVACRMGSALSARVTVDDALRPVREEYVDAAGNRLIVATYEYADAQVDAQPRALVIEDPSSGARMAIQVRRSQTRATPRS